MARQLIMTINLGLDDQRKYGLPSSPNGEFPPQEGDVISVDDERKAEIMVNVLKVAKDYDAEELRKHREAVEDQDFARMEAVITAQNAREEAEKKAAERVQARRQKMRSVPPQHARPAEAKADDKK